jgi:hypothetical protein
MDTNKAAYWIALGVLALGLNSEYRNGSFVTMHRVASRAESALCRISSRAEQTVALARVLASRDRFQAENLLASADAGELTRDQAELLRQQAQEAADLFRGRVRENVQHQVEDQIRAQVEVIRAQAEMRRAEIEQIRSGTGSEFRFARTINRRMIVVCPKTGARIAVDAGPELADISEDVEDSF